MAGLDLLLVSRGIGRGICLVLRIGAIGKCWLSNNPKSVRKRTAAIVARGQLTGAMAGVEPGVYGLQHGIETSAGDALLQGSFDS